MNSLFKIFSDKLLESLEKVSSVAEQQSNLGTNLESDKILRINPKRSRKNSKGEDIFDVDEEETNASNMGKILLNFSWVTGYYHNPERRSPESKWKVHEGDEQKERRNEEDTGWSNVKGSEGKREAKGRDQEGRMIDKIKKLITWMNAWLS